MFRLDAQGTPVDLSGVAGAQRYGAQGDDGIGASERPEVSSDDGLGGVQ